ncbi:MAG TPA: hypothetical protein VGB21_01970 [Candidatus Methylomirabilis sp.]
MISGVERKDVVKALCVFLFLLMVSCLWPPQVGLTAKDSCETCHTDKSLLKMFLSPLPAPSPAEEEES